MGQADGGGTDGDVVVAGFDRRYKGAINLQLVQRHACQIGERRVACAKVVQREQHSQRLELGHLADDLLRLIGEHAFRQFDLQAVWISACALEDGNDLINEIGLFTQGGTMFSIKTLPAIPKTSTFSVHVEWTIDFS